MDINVEYVSNRKEKIVKILPEIKNKNEKNRGIKLKPSKKKMLVGANIVRQYIIENKRKVYGGMAIDESIKKKNKSKAIYSKDDFPDYDFYTPEPLKDIINITNKLVEAGFEFVQGKEAFHQNTYKIRVENYESELADISYVWNYLYYKIPTIVVNDMHFVHPDFQIMDIYRIITNPITGWVKIEKAYYRALLLEQYYILPKMKSFMKNKFNSCATKCNYSLGQNKPIYILSVWESILNEFLPKKKDYIIIGDVAYNKLIEKSFIIKKKQRMLNKKSKKFVLSIMVNSNKFDKFLNDVINFIKNDINIYKMKEISSQNYHPFLELYGNSTKIYLNNHMIIRIYNTDICQPYQKIDSLLYGSIHLQLLFYYSISFRNLISKNKYKASKDTVTYITSNLEYAREHYYSKHKKLGIEKNPYQELQIECMGNEINTPFQVMIQRKKTRRDFSYNPVKGKLKKDTDFATWNYPNRSGNKTGNLIIHK